MTNAAIDNVARVGQTFMPIEGNSGSSAANSFVRQDGATWCLAVFNYGSSSVNRTIDLNRAGLPAGTYLMTNLWDGTTSTVIGSFNVSLNAKQSKLFRLAMRTPANLSWNTNNTGVWNAGAAANWKNLATSQPVVFNAGDLVLFDDAPGVPTTVSLSGTVSPGSVTINSSNNNFTLSGSGKISGAGSLLKLGASTLTINTTNDFTGSVIIGGGTMRTGAGALASISALTVTNDGTLDFFGNTLSGNKPVFISGDGISGNGALYNSGNDIYNQVLNITLNGNATFGGSHRWDLANGSAISGPYNITLKLAGGYAEWDTVTLAPNVGDIEVVQGAFGIKGMGSSFGNPASTLTVVSEVDFWNSSFGANSGYAKNIHVLSNAAFKVLTSPNTFFNANVTLEEGASWNYFYGSGGQTMNGTYTLNGLTHLVTQDSTITFTNVISGPGGFVWDTVNNDVVFTASNSYSGPTVVGSGLKLVLAGNGAISQSALIFFGGNDSTLAHLDVSGRTDKTLTLTSGQTLAGIGRINGSLVVAVGATLSPAGTNTSLGITTGANAIGAISATNAIILNGTTIIKLNGSGINDAVQSTDAGISFGGTLNLLNISGAPLAADDSFQIFSANSYTGSFTDIVPTTPGPGLMWDTTQLSSGKLKVIAAPSQPVVNSISVLGSSLIFSGTNGPANGSYVVLASTNAATPLINWTAILTNDFDAGGFFRVTNTIAPQTPQFFYRLEVH